MNMNMKINNTRTIKCNNPINSDYFKFISDKSSKSTLKDFIPKLNHNDYFIIKVTNNQKEVSYEEFLKFEYSGYMFFNKHKFNVEQILEWCNFKARTETASGLWYLHKPTPPFNPNKIIIKQ
jgi:hypothetical protein